MVPLSVLDLAPVVQGGSVGEALRRSLDLAQHAERWGYRRFWLAEHHGMTGIASAATSVVIGHVAAGTKSIRVGSGGIMLPNHAPLLIAEQFGTLDALFPGRIDLGLGRAPGSDPLVARALRRPDAVDSFARDVVELRALLGDAQPGQSIVAVPGVGSHVPLFILGSSTFGAQLAAILGLPFAFASHFAPAQLEEAVGIYRALYRPSDENPRPHVILAVNVFAADDLREAELLATSVQQAFVALRRGQPIQLAPPRRDFLDTLAPPERMMIERALACTVIGTPETVPQALEDFAARHGADELIVASQTHDHAARLRSFQIAAAA